MENDIQSDNLFGRRKKMRKIKSALKKTGVTRKKRRRIARKTTKGIVKRGLKKTAGAVLVAPLLPFRGSMKRQLKDKGVATAGVRFPAIVELFYNNVVKKSEANKDSKYEACPEGTFKDNWVFSYEVSSGEQLSDNVVGDIVGSIVNAVIAHFKRKKKEKQAIEAAGLDPKTEMTKADIDAAITTDKVITDLEQKAIDDKNVKAGQIKKIIMYVGIALLVFLGIRMIAKK